MKNIATIIIILGVINMAIAQDVTVCEKIVGQTYDAISKKNADLIMPYLADDFSIAGQTGEIAKMIMPQLFSQLNTQIGNIKKVSEIKTDVLTLVYEADFEGIGLKTSTFVFGQDNKLKALELLKMEVRRMNGNADITKNEQSYFSVPFKRVGNLIAVEAKLNGISRTFLLDSGAPKLILNSAHINKDTVSNKLKIGNVEGVGGQISTMDIEKIESFDLNGIKMGAQEVISMDLAHLEKETKTTFYGLIGFEIYQDYDILFDYQNNMIVFIQPEASDAFISTKFKSKKITEVPFEMTTHIPVIAGFVNGKQYALGIDCGAETNLFDLTLMDELKKECRKLKKDTLAGADKNSIATISGQLASLEIGHIKFKKTDTVFSDISHLNQGYSLKLDGLIGYEILSKQPTLMSYKNKKLVFIK